MGLQAVYERFLQSPNRSPLAENATLQYVTTLKTFKQQGGIIQHLEEQNSNIVKKKSEKVVSAVEGLTAVAVIVETTLEFVSSGGAYLPGLDSFIVDRTATLPVTHFVHFDQDDKITQIRLSWDQADLLKQLDVVGKTGRNWPIFAGRDQLKMITASTTTANEVNPAPTLSPRGRNRNGTERSASPSKKFIKDPHTSLNLFQQEEERRPSAPNAVSPRESHKPAPREMSDLFAAGHEDYEPTGPGGSPKKDTKENYVPPKGAGHKKFQPSRLFDEDSPPPKERQIYKTNPARYDHFDIGDAPEFDTFQHRTARPAEAAIRSKGVQPGQHKQYNQQVSQWDFDDYQTPDKVKQKVRGQDIVHFSYQHPEQGDPDQTMQHPGKSRKDTNTQVEFQDNGTPVHRPVVPKPRKDAATHFNITDEQTPGPRRIIARTKAAAKLYHDPVFGDEEEEKPLATITNTRKDLQSQWDVDDDSPVNGKQGRARKGMESQWGVGDDTAPKPKQRAGGRPDAEKSFWDF